MQCLSHWNWCAVVEYISTGPAHPLFTGSRLNDEYLVHTRLFVQNGSPENKKDSTNTANSPLPGN